MQLLPSPPLLPSPSSLTWGRARGGEGSRPQTGLACVTGSVSTTFLKHIKLTAEARGTERKGRGGKGRAGKGRVDGRGSRQRGRGLRPCSHQMPVWWSGLHSLPSTDARTQTPAGGWRVAVGECSYEQTNHLRDGIPGSTRLDQARATTYE